MGRIKALPGKTGRGLRTGASRGLKATVLALTVGVILIALDTLLLDESKGPTV